MSAILPYLPILIPLGMWLFRLEKRMDAQDFSIASMRREILDKILEVRRNL